MLEIIHLQWEVVLKVFGKEKCIFRGGKVGSMQTKLAYNIYEEKLINNDKWAIILAGNIFLGGFLRK